MPYVFKASFDKANRTSGDGFRGPGLDEGLAILAEVRREIGVPVLTDVHEAGAGRRGRGGRRRAADAGVPLPADRLPGRRSPRPGKPVNVKKGQFLSPAEMEHVVAQDAAPPATTSCW